MNTDSQDKVVHNYQDRAAEPDPEQNGEGGRAVPLGMDHNFPTKLHYMLSTIENDGQGSVISWQPHGRCFMVHDMKEFVNSMLPLWFRQTKFASFQRQLNLYGFQRLTQGRDKNAYYHEYFLRSRPLLAQKIVRTKVKGRGARKASSPETEPKLYDFPWMKETKQTPQVVVGSVRQTAVSCNPDQRVSPTLAVLANLAPAPVTTGAGAPSATVLAGALAWANPPRNLGQALGFLSTLSMSAQATTPLPGGETMFLPTPTSNQQASLNSLLSSFSPPAPAPAPVTSSVASMYVPIAPAPPSQGAEPFKPTLETSNNYSSVLAALKVQHSCAPFPQSQAVKGLFTTPGPAPATYK